MAVKDFPEITADAESWSVIYNTQEFRSELNGASQTAILPGARWSASLTFANRTGRDARSLQGFLTGLQGTAGRFFLTPAHYEPLGLPAGTPVVAVSQSVNAVTLETSGWNANITDLFVSGDYFEINGELKKITADVDSDASGEATLEFAPPLRIAATSGQSIRYTDPRCIMQLKNDDQAAWQVSGPVIYAVTIDAVEALDI
jgi:hypothetical protein